jgi:hypothetical protein
MTTHLAGFRRGGGVAGSIWNPHRIGSGPAAARPCPSLAMDVERYLLRRPCDVASDRFDLSSHPDSTRLQASTIQAAVVDCGGDGMAARAYPSDGKGGYYRPGRFTIECTIQICEEEEQHIAAYAYVLSDQRRHHEIELPNATGGAYP